MFLSQQSLHHLYRLPSPAPPWQLEIAGGLGPTVGKVWRIGIMGHNARPQNMELVIAAFRDGLQQQGKL